MSQGTQSLHNSGASADGSVRDGKDPFRRPPPSPFTPDHPAAPGQVLEAERGHQAAAVLVGGRLPDRDRPARSPSRSPPAPAPTRSGDPLPRTARCAARRRAESSSRQRVETNSSTSAGPKGRVRICMVLRAAGERPPLDRCSPKTGHASQRLGAIVRLLQSRRRRLRGVPRTGTGAPPRLSDSRSSTRTGFLATRPRASQATKPSVSARSCRPRPRAFPGRSVPVRSGTSARCSIGAADVAEVDGVALATTVLIADLRANLG